MPNSIRAAAPLCLLLAVTLSCDRHALAPDNTESLRASGHAASGLSMLDSESFPSPGDAMVVADRATGTFVVTVSRDQNRAFSHRVQTGSLVLISSTPTGDGPVKAAQVGDNIVVVNSFSNDLSVLKLDDAGNLSELSRTPSGGVAPSDVGAVFDDLIIVANRGAPTGDGEGVVLFSVDRAGDLTQISDLLPSGPQPPLLTSGNDPHIVTVARDGTVVVGNSNSNDVTLFDVSRAGNVDILPPASRPVGGSPKALELQGNKLFVATRAPVFGQTQDQIEEYRLNSNRSLTLVGTTNAGFFLTDLEADNDNLFAVTWSSPTAPVNQLRQYSIANRAGPLNLVDDLLLPGTPSFQQAGILSIEQASYLIAVTQFQAQQLRLVEAKE